MRDGQGGKRGLTQMCHTNASSRSSRSFGRLVQQTHDQCQDSWRFCIEYDRNQRTEQFMIREPHISLTILVVEDIAETRDGIERMLKADGYRIALARDEQDAIESAQSKRPDLILVSLAGPPPDVIVTARRIRECAGLGEQVPIVIFYVCEIAEGAEADIGRNVHVTRPDNFNQLRSLITRLLSNTKDRLMAGNAMLQKKENHEH